MLACLWKKPCAGFSMEINTAGFCEMMYLRMLMTLTRSHHVLWPAQIMPYPPCPCAEIRCTDL